jgi:hypothetical protein
VRTVDSRLLAACSNAMDGDDIRFEMLLFAWQFTLRFGLRSDALRQQVVTTIDSFRFAQI